jgi:hypothetical protein
MEGLYTATKDPYFVGLHSTPHPIVFTLLKLEGVDGFFFLSLFHQIPKFLSQYSDFCPLNRIAPPPCVVLQRFFCSQIFTRYCTPIFLYVTVVHSERVIHWQIGSLFAAIADLICQQKNLQSRQDAGTGYKGKGRTHFKIALFYCVYIFLTKLMLPRVSLMVHTVFLYWYFCQLAPYSDPHRSVKSPPKVPRFEPGEDWRANNWATLHPQPLLPTLQPSIRYATPLLIYAPPPS